MFAKTIIDSDAFLNMPMSARLLYYDLGMRADDDGFVNSPLKILKIIGATQDDMNVLIARKFIIPFESGVVVIKHWRINNYLRNDRYNETQYVEEKSLLTLDSKGKYHLANGSGIPLGIPTVSTGKDSIGKDSIGKISLNNNILSGKKSDNEKNTEKKRTFSDEISKIINYLNDVLGTRYTTKSKSTNEKIKARLEEGHTVEDFKTVIDNKKKEWGNDPKMVKYLRPETLFRASHFESYLNIIENEATKNRREKEELDAKQRAGWDDSNNPFS